MTISTVEFIQRMSQTSSRLDKEEILKEAWTNGERALFTAIQLTYDILTTFGVKKVVEIIDDDESDFIPTFTFENFLALAEKLSTRQLTGHAARDAINAAAETCTKDEWNILYRRILLKDLRCGISESTVNKVLEKINKESKKTKGDTVDVGEALRYLTPVFECQLAHPSEKYQNKMKGQKLLDMKLDGCLSTGWELEFEDGRKIKIGDIVDNQIQGKVKSMNVLTGQMEYQDIIGWAKNGIDINDENIVWYRITLENGYVLPPLTGNHLLWLPKLGCWRRMDLLKEDDILLFDE